MTYFENLVNTAAAELKVALDDIKNAATGQIALSVTEYVPSLAPLLKILATDAAYGSSALAVIPALETLYNVATAMGMKPATVDQQIEFHKDSQPGG